MDGAGDRMSAANTAANGTLVVPGDDLGIVATKHHV